MASTNGKQAKEIKAADAPAPAAAPVEAAPAPVETAPSTAVVLSTAASEPVAGVSAGFEAAFDSSKWSKKSFDIWNENTTAFFDFAEQFAKVKTVEEAADLQSKFFSARLDVILKQSTELLELAQEMIQVSIAPLYSAKAA